ncbi:MAG: hypothetical protein ACLFWD_00765 [Anaerolineales bacterium]
MTKRVSLATYLILALLAGCSRAGIAGPVATESSDPSRAAIALMSYFRQLADGEYREAASYYGGSYQILRDQNPPLDPNDNARLFQQACEANGYICLPVGEVVGIQEIGSGEYQISVQFIKPEGEVFVRGPCCGASEEEMSRQSTFEFRVAPDASGQYKVMDLPVYVP